MILNMSGGGAPLNFKVVGGTTEPENPKENTIWVNTDVPITGWYFSANQPENMAEGEVWITTGNRSAVEFNILKKNVVQVYPLSAKQYVGGARVDKPAKSYQVGEWVEWFTYLYDVGNVFEELTGGYNSFLYKGGGSASVDSDGMHIQATKTESYYYPQTGLYTVNKIDLTKYNTIKVEGTLNKNGGGGNFCVGVYPNEPPNLDSHLAINYHGTEGAFEVAVDISNVTGSYYLAVAAMINYDQGAATPVVTVTKIWLE